MPSISPMPTKVGDVLIVCTAQSFRAYVIGRISYDGQQDFHRQTGMAYEPSTPTAVAAAKQLVLPGGTIFYRNLDRGTWKRVK